MGCTGPNLVYPSLGQSALLATKATIAPRPRSPGRRRGRRTHQPPTIRGATGRVGPRRPHPPAAAPLVRRRFLGRTIATPATNLNSPRRAVDGSPQLLAPLASSGGDACPRRRDRALVDHDSAGTHGTAGTFQTNN